jgi:hypothetical protein
MEEKKKKGRPRKIESPEQLHEIFKAYKKYVKENPRYKYTLSHRTGDMVPEPLECPLTMEGFEVYCWQKFDLSVNHYFDNQKNAYEDFCTICTHIRREIRNDQISGGMVGQYNASITQRLNNLKEQVENTNIEQPLFNLNEFKDNDSDKENL